MEEAELDEWFNEQKELLEERFYAEAQKDTAKAKERFDHDYRKLIAQLQERQQSLYEHRLRMAQLQKPLARVRERVRLWQEARRQDLQQARLAVKKWFFDRKVKRILDDKSDL